MVGSALACVAALAFPVVFSSDAYAYAGYGFMALHGISPYAHAYVSLRDPLMNAVLWQWGNPPPVCVYGPAFVWFAQGIVALFGPLGPAATLWAFRIAACIALVACAPLAYAAFVKLPERTRLAAAAGIALNPIAIWSCAEGHNDVFVLALALAGFALIARSRLFAGALLLGLSPLVKLPGLLAAVAAVLGSWSDRSRFWRVATGALAGAALSAIVAWPQLAGLRLHVVSAGHYFPQFSLQYIMSSFLPERAAIGIAVILAFACAIAGWVHLTKRNLAGVPWIALAIWIAIPNPYPWYALWILPAAFVAWETPAAWAIVALTLCTVVRYYPDATTDLSTGLNLAIAGLPLAMALIIFIERSKRSRWDRRENRMPVPDLAISRSP